LYFAGRPLRVTVVERKSGMEQAGYVRTYGNV
jgi:hypothetical protein